MKRCFATVGGGDSREEFTFDVDDDGPDVRNHGKLSNFQPPEFEKIYAEAFLAYHGFQRRAQIAAQMARGIEDNLGYPSSSVYVDRMEDLPEQV